MPSSTVRPAGRAGRPRPRRPPAAGRASRRRRAGRRRPSTCRPRRCGARSRARPRGPTPRRPAGRRRPGRRGRPSGPPTDRPPDRDRPPPPPRPPPSSVGRGRSRRPRPRPAPGPSPGRSPRSSRARRPGVRPGGDRSSRASAGLRAVVGFGRPLWPRPAGRSSRGRPWPRGRPLARMAGRRRSGPTLRPRPTPPRPPRPRPDDHPDPRRPPERRRRDLPRLRPALRRHRPDRRCRPGRRGRPRLLTRPLLVPGRPPPRGIARRDDRRPAGDGRRGDSTGPSLCSARRRLRSSPDSRASRSRPRPSPRPWPTASAPPSTPDTPGRPPRGSRRSSGSAATVASFGEVKTRADVIVLWDVDPTVTHPRLPRTPGRPSRPLRPRRPGRPDRSSSSTAASRRPGPGPTRLWPSPPAGTPRYFGCSGLSSSGSPSIRGGSSGPAASLSMRLAGWADRLKAARYGAIAFGTSLADEGPEAVEALFRLIDDLNRTTRCVALAAGRPRQPERGRGGPDGAARGPAGRRPRRRHPSPPARRRRRPPRSPEEADAVLDVGRAVALPAPEDRRAGRPALAGGDGPRRPRRGGDRHRHGRDRRRRIGRPVRRGHAAPPAAAAADPARRGGGPADPARSPRSNGGNADGG